MFYNIIQETNLIDKQTKVLPIIPIRTIKNKTTWKAKRIDKDGADKLAEMTSKLPFLNKSIK